MPLPRTTAPQLRSARGAGALPSLGIVRLESIGAVFEPEPIAGDDGMPGSAAAGVGLLVCAPGVTRVAFGLVGVGVVGAGVVAFEPLGRGGALRQRIARTGQHRGQGGSAGHSFCRSTHHELLW